jgi:hypothetical protein
MNKLREQDVLTARGLTIGLSAVVVYVSCGLIVAKHWTTDTLHVPFAAGVYGSLLFVPLFGGVLVAQVILKRLTRFILKSRPSVRLLCIGLLPLLVLVYALNYVHMSDSNRARAIREFFSSPPTSAKVLAFGYERTALGDGSYVLVFQLSNNELNALLNREGYVVTELNSDPDDYQLSVFNSVLSRLTGTHVRIDPHSKHSTKRTASTDAHVFYDTDHQTAIFLGFGRYKVRV